MNCFPHVRVDLRCVDQESELLIYDERTHLYHCLNSTARRIWQLCDGAHGVPEIVEEVSRLFPDIAVDALRGDVETALTALDERNLIVWVPQEASQPGMTG